MEYETSPITVGEVFVELPYLITMKHQVERLIRTGSNGHERKGMCIVGPTGIGKTMFLKTIFSDKKYRTVRQDEGLVSPIIRIDARPNCTTKGIAELLLEALGDEKPSRGTEHDMVNRVFKQLRMQKTQLIVIDEAQCLASRGYAASDFLKHLLNQGNCPLLLVGLEPTDELRTGNSQLKGRCLTTVWLSAFDYSKPQHRTNWRGLLKEIQSKVKELQGQVDLTKSAVAAALNFAARGLLRELRELLEEAIDIADGRCRGVTIQDLAEAFDRRRLGAAQDVINPFLEELPEAWKPAAMSEGTDQNRPKRHRATKE